MRYLKQQLPKIIKETKDKVCTVKIETDKTVELYNEEEDVSKILSFSYNNKYVVVWESYYDCPIINVLAAYDIEKERKIDCSDNYINDKLIDSVVRIRRCMYDVVASIILDEELMVDKYRLYSFISFIINKTVDESNFHEYSPIIKEYILNKYPELNNQKIYTSKKDLIIMNERYGIDYFVFKKMEYNIEGIKYIKNKELVKR
jgi:hypothetical protein